MKRFFIGSFFILTGLIVLGVVYMFATTPQILEFSKVKNNYSSSDLFLLDRNGNFLDQVRSDYKSRKLMWTDLADISVNLQDEVLKSEDKRFYQHSGVDYSALVAAIKQRLDKKSSRGASTLSMQLLKIIVPNNKIWSGYTGKLRQILMAHQLESNWSKAEILEAYLNLIPFRGESIGVMAASQSLFGVLPKDLTPMDSVLLSVLIRSPNAQESKWIERACKQDNTFCPYYQSRLGAVRAQAYREQRWAPHLSARLLKSKTAGVFKTSIDADLQKYITERIQENISELGSYNVHDAAVLVIENKTGEVYAYVAGAGGFSKSPAVDMIEARRQAGSTIKPFIYAQNFAKGFLAPQSWIEDSPVDIVFDRGVYSPKNHDKKFYGWVKVADALGSSLNVPAVKAYSFLDADEMMVALKNLGFKELQSADHYGPSLALGSMDVTLSELTNAYRVLALGGYYGDIKFNSDQELVDVRTVFKKEAAQAITQILSESSHRLYSFGLDSQLSIPGAAVKTGTSKDMRDNWCIGYNDRFTVGVWVGNSSGEPMWNVMGVTGAGPIWNKTMRYLIEKFPEPSAEKVAEESLGTELALTDDTASTLTSIQNPISTPASASAGSTEKPTIYSPAQIRYPKNGTIIAIDPDIPLHKQKVPLIPEGKTQENYRWKIDNADVASAEKTYLWEPQKGTHKIDLFKGEEIIHSSEIIVR